MTMWGLLLQILSLLCMELAVLQKKLSALHVLLAQMHLSMMKRVCPQMMTVRSHIFLALLQCFAFA